jgi:hypothetical protein
MTSSGIETATFRLAAKVPQPTTLPRIPPWELEIPEFANVLPSKFSILILRQHSIG